MFPETDTLVSLFAEAETVLFRRRLVDRVLRIWRDLARGGRFPRRDQIEPSMLGDDWVNCCIIAVRSPINLSHVEAVGANLSYAHCPDDSLVGVLLAHLPMVLSEQRCLMIEGRAPLGGLQVLYRGALFPLSADGAAIDHVLGAANYRPLQKRDQLFAPPTRRKWL